jgi:hypothetical protein
MGSFKEGIKTGVFMTRQDSENSASVVYQNYFKILNVIVP